MSDKVFLGNRAGGLETGDVPPKISRVNLAVASDTGYTAGDDTGRTLEAACPWGSQAMANSILAAVRDDVYRPYTAWDALLDPAAELGDGVTVGGVYSLLAQLDLRADGLCAAELSAPAGDEIDDEYPYETKTARQLARTNSRLTKTAEEIRLEVEGVSGQVSALSVTVSGVSAAVSDPDTGLGTKLSLDASGLIVSGNGGRVSVQGGQLAAGSVTAEQIDATDLNVNAANVAGTLSAGSLDLSGALPLKSGGTLYGYMGVNLSKGGPVLCDGTAQVYFVATGQVAKMSSHEDNMIWVDGSSNGCYSSKPMQVYSDRRLKHSVGYGLGKYEGLFGALRPCVYKYSSEGEGARFRIGFVAQDVLTAALDSGLTEEDLALLGRYDGMYSIGYGEFAALNTHMIQRLMGRVEELEARLFALEAQHQNRQGAE